MSATAGAVPAKVVSAKSRIAKITSKGQITIPVEVRRLLGAKPGDKLVFEPTADGIRVARQTQQDAIETMRGIGVWLPKGYEGREGVIRYIREMRGHDEIDDLMFGAE